MSAKGEFVFSTGRDVIADFAPDESGTQDLLDGTVSSGGGYLEAQSRATGSFTMSPDRSGAKPPALMAHTSGRFQAVGPAAAVTSRRHLALRRRQRALLPLCPGRRAAGA